MRRKMAFGKWIIATAIVAAMPGTPSVGFAQLLPPPPLADVLETVTPAVVNISVASRAPGAENPLYGDPFFRRYFNLPDAPPPRVQLSAGSGVIVDSAQGLVLTNHHVVANGERILVTLRDRREFEATLVGSDEATDIALLKIDPQNLTALRLADPSKLRVGDDVVAIGNPFGLGQTVTAGIVSALGRSGINLEGYEDFIQTDASINPGNSGGALINRSGELVGINTAIVAPAGGNVGIGFAVPTNMAKTVMDQLLAHGEVQRGRLGVAVQDVTPDLARALGLSQIAGALISAVEPGSPARAAGVLPGDVVVGINDREVVSASDLRTRIGLTPAGQSVTLSLLRNNQPLTVSATVAGSS
jgi:serine protease DegQ